LHAKARRAGYTKGCVTKVGGGARVALGAGDSKLRSEGGPRGG